MFDLVAFRKVVVFGTQVNREMVEIIAGIQAAAAKAAQEQAETEAEGGDAVAEVGIPEEDGEEPEDDVSNSEADVGEESEEDLERRRKGKGLAEGLVAGSGNGLENGVNGHREKAQNGTAGTGAEANGSVRSETGVNGLVGSGVHGAGTTEKQRSAGEGATRKGEKTDPALATLEQADREAEFQNLVAKYPTFGEEVLRDMMVRTGLGMVRTRLCKEAC